MIQSLYPKELATRVEIAMPDLWSMKHAVLYGTRQQPFCKAGTVVLYRLIAITPGSRASLIQSEKSRAIRIADVKGHREPTKSTSNKSPELRKRFRGIFYT